MMGHLVNDPGPIPKCYFSVTPLPTFVNHNQPPTTKKPFSVILQYPFCRIVSSDGQTWSWTSLMKAQLEVTLTKASLDAFQTQLSHRQGYLQYARVYMKPSDLIEGDFINSYIKQGNILMLSERRAGIDHALSLSNGVMRLEVDKATYERLGLIGKPVRDEGRKHIKSRFEVEINLRLPSMAHGKKAFARVEWAFKNVLNQSMAWLFHDFKAATDGTGPIAIHQPLMHSIGPAITNLHDARVPATSTDFEDIDLQEATELLEWLHLVRLGSSRLCEADSIDRYLSRYDVPSFGTFDDRGPQALVEDLVTLKWRGFVPPSFATRIFLASLSAADSTWFAMTASSFTGGSYTILKTGGYAFAWEYED